MDGCLYDKSRTEVSNKEAQHLVMHSWAASTSASIRAGSHTCQQLLPGKRGMGTPAASTRPLSESYNKARIVQRDRRAL